MRLKLSQKLEWQPWTTTLWLLPTIQPFLVALYSRRWPIYTGIAYSNLFLLLSSTHLRLNPYSTSSCWRAIPHVNVHMRLIHTELWHVWNMNSTHMGASENHWLESPLRVRVARCMMSLSSSEYWWYCHGVWVTSVTPDVKSQKSNETLVQVPSFILDVHHFGTFYFNLNKLPCHVSSSQLLSRLLPALSPVS